MAHTHVHTHWHRSGGSTSSSSRKSAASHPVNILSPLPSLSHVNSFERHHSKKNYKKKEVNQITQSTHSHTHTEHTHAHLRALYIHYMRSSVDRRRSLKLLPVVSSLSRQIVRCLVKRESKTSYSSFISIHSHPFIHSIERKPAFGGSIHRLGPFRADVGVVL